MKRGKCISIIVIFIVILGTLYPIQYSFLTRKRYSTKQRLKLHSYLNNVRIPEPEEQFSNVSMHKNTDATEYVKDHHDREFLRQQFDEAYPTLDDCLEITEDDRKGNNQILQAIPDITTDEEVVEILNQGCEGFRDRYNFISAREEEIISTAEELNFSIAYTLLVHKNLHQIATLLSAIYRTQHIYCVHADNKSKDVFLRGIRKISKCFANVFQPSKTESVVYASFSRLNAEVHCMEDLLRIPSNLYDWRYLINLCGQDFPTTTNYEIVKQLMSMNGRICLSGTTELNQNAVNRVKYVHKIQKLTTDNTTASIVRQTWKLLDPPPYNLTIAKSMAYAVFTREFLQWALIDSEEGRALYNWTAYTRTPDEHFWATLHIYPKSPRWSKTLNWRGIARAMVWKGTKEERFCTGYWQHNACVFGGGSLRWLAEVPQLFINKFDMRFDSLPIRCLRNLIDERSKGNANDLNPIKTPMKL